MKTSNATLGCRVSCTGLYVDVNYSLDDKVDGEEAEGRKKLAAILEQYKEYRRNYARNKNFDQKSDNFGMYSYIMGYHSNLSLDSCGKRLCGSKAGPDLLRHGHL
jgi:hypothetical protein